MISPVTIGRIVHYHLADDTEGTPILRPAIVVRVWDPDTGCANLQVFVDGRNDLGRDEHGVVLVKEHEAEQGLAWRTSICEGTCPGTWRWPARS